MADRAAAELHLAVLRALRAGLDPADALRQAFDELEAATADPDCGSTVAALLLSREAIVTAHVGDSRVVRVGRAGSESLTRDHRIDVDDERARVLRMGAELDPPYVVRGDRGLMMTRSLGDRWFRPVGVIPEPEVGRHALEADDVALVAATDGVWDVLSVEDAAPRRATGRRRPGRRRRADRRRARRRRPRQRHGRRGAAGRPRPAPAAGRP